MGILRRGHAERASAPRDMNPTAVTSADPSGNARPRGKGSTASFRSRAERRERAACAVNYLPLVRSLAGRFRRRSSVVTIDDLVSAGTVGLLEAIERYDPDRGVPLGAFAYPRIKGAIADEFRREISSGQDVSAPTVTASLDAPLNDSEEEVRLLDVTPDTTSPEPFVCAELNELVDAVRRLPVRERDMLALHANGYSVGEIADCHGCSPARVSAILGRARLRLAQAVAA